MGSHEDFGRRGRYKTLISYLKEKVLTPALFLWYNIIKERWKKELNMRDAYDLEGYTVFALIVIIEDKEPELWGVYSNVMACFRKGEKVCDAFGALGVKARYRCAPYDVKGK